MTFLQEYVPYQKPRHVQLTLARNSNKNVDHFSVSNTYVLKSHMGNVLLLKLDQEFRKEKCNKISTKLLSTM